MHVVIPCGGKCTRMRGENEYKPKPLVEIGGDGLINGGFYALNREIFDYLTEKSNFELDAMPKLAKEKELSIYEHQGFLQAIET